MVKKVNENVITLLLPLLFKILSTAKNVLIFIIERFFCTHDFESKVL